MKIYPAIDLFDGKAVRLFKGDYNEMTVYSECPEDVARDFVSAGATHIHLVDLEGAKDGTTPNIQVVKRIVKACPNAFVEIGGGIRSIEVARAYLDAGVSRVILGTAAVTNPEFLDEALALFGDRVAVGVDVKDGMVAIKGWTEKSDLEAFEFMKSLEKKGVSTVICTDISRDGAMKGTNVALYEYLCKTYSGCNIVASGGVSSYDDIEALLKIEGLWGAIVGKACYTGDIDVARAVEMTEAKR